MSRDWSRSARAQTGLVAEDGGRRIAFGFRENVEPFARDPIGTANDLISLFFLAHAVNALKPRSRQMGLATEGSLGKGVHGLRLVDDILKHRPEEFYEVWRTAPAGSINREMALQVHLLAQTTAEKYAALRKVYIGIMILLALTAVFLTILGIHVFAPGIV